MFVKTVLKKVPYQPDHNQELSFSYGNTLIF